jgi:molybdopterin converting factor small subunit
MPTVKVKITGWLRETLTSSPSSPEILVSVPEGETLSAMVRRFAVENPCFWEVISDTMNQGVGRDVIVILNGSIVNPYDCDKLFLKEGDELVFLPMVAGGSGPQSIVG